VANLILPRRFTKQPQYPVELDHSHQIGSKALFLWTPGPHPLIVSSKNIGFGTPNGTVVQSVTDNGKVLQFHPFGGANGLVTLNTGVTSDSDVTMFWAGYPSTTTTYLGVMNRGNPSGNDSMRLGMGTTASYIDTSPAQTDCNLSSKSLTVNLFEQKAITKKGTSLSHYDWRTKQIATSSGGTGSFRADSAGNYFYVNRDAHARSLIGAAFTALTDAEVYALFENPWQIFKPRKQVLYFDVGGGATNTDSAASAGSIAITGSAANGVRTLLGVASSGSVAITGSAANGTRAKVSNAESGSITITGSTAAALRTLQAVATQGSVTITGVAASGAKAGAGNTNTAADSGSITITGFTANGTRTLTSAATAGSVVLTGSAASGAKTILGTADSGSITITGSDASVARTYLGVAGSGSVVITGSSAVGTKSGTTSLSAADIQAIVDALMSDPRMLTLPKWIALR
jgi:hypothetical protein